MGDASYSEAEVISSRLPMALSGFDPIKKPDPQQIETTLERTFRVARLKRLWQS